MKIWQFKTLRHGATLIEALTFAAAVAAFIKFHRAWLTKNRMAANDHLDEIGGVQCLGELAHP